jgi:hypothetical protein
MLALLANEIAHQFDRADLAEFPSQIGKISSGDYGRNPEPSSRVDHWLDGP